MVKTQFSIHYLQNENKKPPENDSQKVIIIVKFFNLLIPPYLNMVASKY